LLKTTLSILFLWQAVPLNPFQRHYQEI
jgi:hypothetical protein